MYSDIVILGWPQPMGYTTIWPRPAVILSTVALSCIGALRATVARHYSRRLKHQMIGNYQS